MSNSKRPCIAISGKSGCGNTTVGTLISELMGFKMINYTFHNLAEEKGIPFEQFCKMAESDPQWDYSIDEKQKSEALRGNCVLSSRLSIWLMRESECLSVYLNVSKEERTRRIIKREGGSFDEQLKVTIERDRRDHNRYLKLYGIDNDDYGFVDVVINGEAFAPECIVTTIATLYREKYKLSV